MTARTQSEKKFRAANTLLKVIDRNFREAAEQYYLLAKYLPPGQFPNTYFPSTGKYEFSNSGWWCSGFYPGSLLSLYGQTKDPFLLEESRRILHVLEKEKNKTGTHDLWFMMYCSFGNAERLASQPAYKDILLQSAWSLMSRFNPPAGCIRSWNSKPGEFLVIIENMMNLGILFWAT